MAIGGPVTVRSAGRRWTRREVQIPGDVIDVNACQGPDNGVLWRRAAARSPTKNDHPSGKANAVARVRQSQRPGSVNGSGQPVNGLVCGGSAGVFQFEELPSTQDNTAQWM
jgi:hypothetical protein